MSINRHWLNRTWYIPKMDGILYRKGKSSLYIDTERSSDDIVRLKKKGSKKAFKYNIFVWENNYIHVYLNIHRIPLKRYIRNG